MNSANLCQKISFPPAPYRDMEAQQPIAIDIPDLAKLVGANVRSFRNAFYLRPQDFPPAINIPGCRGVRFLMADVLVWLDSLKAAKAPASRTEPPALRTRGRPRIAQQIGKGVRA